MNVKGKMFRRSIVSATVVVVLGVSMVVSTVWVGRASAAQTATVGGNALKISPVRMDLTMDPGTSKTVDVFITNLTSVVSSLHGVINDFGPSSDESGTPSIILDENTFAPTHSLKRFTKPIGDMILKAGEQRTVHVTITVPADAAGGGYYGAVRFAPTSLTGDKNLNLSASVGAIVLLRVNGDVTENLKVESFDVRKNNKPGSFFVSPDKLKATVRFSNEGNVQVQPFGTILVKRFGKVVEQIAVNDDDTRGSVLPDSIRRFDFSFGKLSSFGKYTMQGNFGYGSSGQLLTAQTTFYIIPVTLMLIALGVVLLLAFLIFVLPRMIRAYNRHIIRKASRRR